MPRYKLKDTCQFVDVYDYGKDSKTPDRSRQGIPSAYVMDKSEEAKKNDQFPCTQLDDQAGFIGHFIVMGVETDFLLPQITASEYGISPTEAFQKVNNTLKLMEYYLEEIQPTGALESQTPRGADLSANLEYSSADFSIRPPTFSIVVFK
jgi:hypothetical protein